MPPRGTFSFPHSMHTIGWFGQSFYRCYWSVSYVSIPDILQLFGHSTYLNAHYSRLWVSIVLKVKSCCVQPSFGHLNSSLSRICYRTVWIFPTWPRVPVHPVLWHFSGRDYTSLFYFLLEPVCIEPPDNCAANGLYFELETVHLWQIRPPQALHSRGWYGISLHLRQQIDSMWGS